MSQLHKFAIIGCGQIALRHASLIKELGELQAICDIVPDKANVFAKKFPAKAYFTIEELLKNESNVDVIVVCTPNGLHAQHSIQSMQSGKDVLCEKPMAITLADGKRMIEVEKQTGKKLFVVKQNRFNPPVTLLKKMIDDKKLGRILSFQLNCFWNRPQAYYQNSSWRGKKDLDGGILFTQFSHFIDLLYWLLGDVDKAQGARQNALHTDCVEFEDSGAAVLQMKNQAIGTINYTINSHKKNMEGSLSVFGENGTVKIGGQYLNELEYFSVNDEAFPELPHSKPANQYGYYEGSMSNHDKVYENLLKALDDSNHDFINSQETLKTIEIIEKIYEGSPL